MSSPVTIKMVTNDELTWLQEELISKGKVIATNSEKITEVYREQLQLDNQLQAIAIENQILQEQGDHLSNRIDLLDTQMEQIQRSDITMQAQRETLDKTKEIAGLVIVGLIAAGIVFCAIRYT